MKSGFFYYLVEVLSPKIFQKTKKHKRGKTQHIDIVEHLHEHSSTIFYWEDIIRYNFIYVYSHSELFCSIWMVVNTVEMTKFLEIQFPKDYVEQRKLSLGFQKKS